MKVEQQVIVIFAGVRGFLDKIPVSDITKFEEFLLEKIKNESKDILEKIEKEKSLNENLEDDIKKFLENLVDEFLRVNNA